MHDGDVIEDSARDCSRKIERGSNNNDSNPQSEDGRKETGRWVSKYM